MSLKDEVMTELKAAMRAKNAERLEVLRAIRGDILKIEKSGIDVVATEDDIIKTIKSQIKQREDAVSQFKAAGRDELASKEEAAIAIFREFLPEALTEEELTAIVTKAVADTGATTQKQMGLVMKAVREAVASTGKDADNRLVAGLVKTALS